MRLRLLVPLLALPMALSACGSLEFFSACRADYQRPDFAALSGRLDVARLKWQAYGFQNYRYDFSQFAAPVGFPAVRVTVQAGEVVKVEQVETGPNLTPSDVGKTIDKRFTDIASAIERATQTPCAELALTFDATDGHPLTFSTGVALKNLADGNGAWTISNFTRL